MHPQELSRLQLQRESHVPLLVFDGLSFRLARRLPLEDICLAGGAFSCSWPSVVYISNFGNVAEIEMKPNILEFLLRSGPRVGLPGLVVGRVDFRATFWMFCGFVMKETFAAPPNADIVVVL